MKKDKCIDFIVGFAVSSAVMVVLSVTFLGLKVVKVIYNR
jgi:hypothetical protein